jgi:S1-C subfamily serine protease
MEQKRKDMLKWSWIALLALAALACGSFIPLATSQPANPNVQQPIVQVFSQPTPTALAVPGAVVDEQSVLINLYARVNPAVVNITDYTSHQGQILPTGQGSGFVYDTSGHIITNEHVVLDSEQLEVTFSDGTVAVATIVGEDLNSDLAVVKVDNLPDGVAPLPLGNLDKVAVGQTVVAIGNPFGLEGTLTRGIVSALGRTIPALTQFSIPLSIQTDAAINPGNSGGPLLNLQGEVIGVNAQIETGSTNTANSGVGFAVPVNIIKLVVPDLIEKGKHDWAWLGVRGGSLTPGLIDANNLPVTKGAYITEVVSGGPSDKAGLRGSTGTTTVNGRETLVGGDVVIAVNGVTVNSFDDLLIYVSLQSKPGDEVTLTIVRNGKNQDLKVVLEPRPAEVSG